MASIQVLELRPVEAQIEELSYDMTDSIRGGDLFDAVKILVECYSDFIRDISDGRSDPDIFRDFARCYNDAVEALYA